MAAVTIRFVCRMPTPAECGYSRTLYLIACCVDNFTRAVKDQRTVGFYFYPYFGNVLPDRLLRFIFIIQLKGKCSGRTLSDLFYNAFGSCTLGFDPWALFRIKYLDQAALAFPADGGMDATGRLPDNGHLTVRVFFDNVLHKKPLSKSS